VGEKNTVKFVAKKNQIKAMRCRMAFIYIIET